jgi:hypothetical protein
VAEEYTEEGRTPWEQQGILTSDEARVSDPAHSYNIVHDLIYICKQAAAMLCASGSSALFQ